MSFFIGDRNAKVGSQKVPGVMGKCGLGVQNEAGQSLTEFCQENALSQQSPSSDNTREDSTHGHRQTRDGKGERRHSRNQQTKMDWNG